MRSYDVPGYKDIFKSTHALVHHPRLPATSPTQDYLKNLFNPMKHTDLLSQSELEQIQEQTILEKKSTVCLHTFIVDLQRGTYDGVLESVKEVGIKLDTGLELRTSTALPLEDEFFQQLQREKKDQ